MQKWHGALPPHKTYVFHRPTPYKTMMERFVKGERVREVVTMHGATVAVTFPAGMKDLICGIGTAQCSGTDQFCKKTGVSIAKGRAEKSLSHMSFKEETFKLQPTFNPKHLEYAKRVADEVFHSLEYKD